MKLAIALLAISSSTFAQTPAPTPAKPPVHHSVPATGVKPASPIPKVVGIPKTLYALKYVDTKIGTGVVPEAMRFYTVNYTGYLPDGTKFDSSVDPAFKHPTPFTFPYGGHRVIPGWDTGFEGMRVGGKRRLFVPYQLAYGVMGSPPKIPAKSNLIFDVELVSFSEKPPAPPTPRPAPPTAPGTPPPATTPPPAGTAPAPATPPAPGTQTAPPPSGAPATPPPATAPVKPATPPTK